MPGPLKQIAVIPVIDAGADDHRAFAPHFFLQRSIGMRNAVLDTNFGGTDGSPESSACHERSAGVGRAQQIGMETRWKIRRFNCDPSSPADAARVDEFSLYGSCKTVASHATYSFPSPVGRCLGVLPSVIAAPTPNHLVCISQYPPSLEYFNSHWDDFVVLCRETYLERLSRLVVN
jgi:hypothetical protein